MAVAQAQQAVSELARIKSKIQKSEIWYSSCSWKTSGHECFVG